ncbi:MAG: phage major capsid protein [Epibacterium sp.]
MKKSLMPAIAMAAMITAAPASAVLLSGLRNEAVDPERLLREVNQKLDSLNGEVKQTAEDALQQAKQAGEVSQETKRQADQLLTAQNTLKQTADKITEQLEGQSAQILELSQSVAAGMGRGGSGAPMSMGQAALAEGGEQIKAFLSNGAKGSLSIPVHNAITSASGSGGGLITGDEERTPVNMARRRLRIVNLLSRGRTGTNLVTFRKQVLRTDATAAIAEGGTYPVSAFGWEKSDAKVKKIGAVTNITEETMADADQLQTEIDVELRYGLDLEEEKQILAGDGIGENLHGLIPNATAFAAAAGLPNQTRIDRLRLAVLQVVLADYIPTAFVLNPLDWAAIDLLKDADGRYIFGSPHAQSTPMLWGKDVVESATMTQNEWLTGDLEMAATYYDRSEAEVLISSEHDQNFVEDMLTMKARKRAALAHKRPAAMVTGDFTFV